MQWPFLYWPLAISAQCSVPLRDKLWSLLVGHDFIRSLSLTEALFAKSCCPITGIGSASQSEGFPYIILFSLFASFTSVNLQWTSCTPNSISGTIPGRINSQRGPWKNGWLKGWVWKVQGEPGTSCYTRKFSKNNGSCQKDLGTILKRLPLAKSGKICTSK